MITPTTFPAFRALSARLGQDRLRVQGPGGNTSLKEGDVMWVKASGTELADAQTADIFVAVDRAAALAEAREQAGDGSCRATILDPTLSLRPSIETTFHAALDWPVVVHTHSIATLTHAISTEGLRIAQEKLAGLPCAFVPYAKPGLPLTRNILRCIGRRTQVIVLANHGLVICGPNVAATADLMEEVETRLAMQPKDTEWPMHAHPPPDGFSWAQESWIATDPVACARATAGSYYPDHVVFLGPALPRADHAGKPPAFVVEGRGIALRLNATASQKAMLRCLSDVLSRLPIGWNAKAIGPDAEAELLNWDAEKYRQALAARS